MSSSNDWEVCPHCGNDILRWEDDSLIYHPHDHLDWDFDGLIRCPFCGYETYYISDPMSFIEPCQKNQPSLAVDMNGKIKYAKSIK